jgi:hypothetical protein
MHFRKYVACLALFGALSLSAQAADTLTFDDLGYGVTLSKGEQYEQYKGFTWSNFMSFSSKAAQGNGYASGYTAMYKHSGMGILNWEAQGAQLVRVDGSLFDFGSADMIAAWNDGLHVTVTGWLGDEAKYTQLVTLDSTVVSPKVFNFTDIDKLTFSSFGGMKNPLNLTNGTHFAIDNMNFNVTTAVPEPSSYAMLLAGLTMVGFIARKRKVAG